MDIVTASDAETHFGALLDKAQREPVTISKDGRAVAVVMSKEAFDEHQQHKLDFLKQEVGKGLDDLQRGAVVSGADAFRELDRELGDA